RLPARNQLYRTNVLMRELIRVLSEGGLSASQHKRRLTLLTELLHDAEPWPDTLDFPHWDAPDDPRVRRICDYVHENLDSPKALQEWAAELRCDPRTLHRLFVREFGISFVQWRQQV